MDFLPFYKGLKHWSDLNPQPQSPSEELNLGPNVCKREGRSNGKYNALTSTITRYIYLLKDKETNIELYLNLFAIVNE